MLTMLFSFTILLLNILRNYISVHHSDLVWSFNCNLLLYIYTSQGHHLEFHFGCGFNCLWHSVRCTEHGTFYHSNLLSKMAVFSKEVRCNSCKSYKTLIWVNSFKRRNGCWDTYPPFQNCPQPLKSTMNCIIVVM